MMYSGRPGGGRNYGMASDEEKQNRPKITKGLIFRIYSYLKPYWFWLLLAISTIILTSILDVMPAILTGRIIDEGFIGGNFFAVGISYCLIAWYTDSIKPYESF